MHDPGQQPVLKSDSSPDHIKGMEIKMIVFHEIRFIRANVGTIPCHQGDMADFSIYHPVLPIEHE
jgi:hypothetical protein